MKRANGFTLVELLFTLLLAAVVVGLAAPDLRNFIQNNEASADTNELVSALNTARSDAVTRGATVSVCASSDGATCNGSTNWATGWIVFIDTGSFGGTCAPGTILQTGDALSGATVTGSVSCVQYGSSGLTSSAAAVVFGLIVGKQTRTVSLTTTGNVSAN